LFASAANQSRIDCKSFATDQTGGNACLDDPFETGGEEHLDQGRARCRRREKAE
jgi:hypothetical protein